MARFVQSSEDEDEEDLECEDIVFQLPTWTPPPTAPRQERSRSFPRRWNPSGGLRRAAGRLSATSRLLGRRSVPSSWDGRRALEQALLFAAAVPLRASSSSTTESEQRGLDSVTDTGYDTTTATGPPDSEAERQSSSDAAQNSLEHDWILSPQATAENETFFIGP